MSGPSRHHAPEGTLRTTRTLTGLATALMVAALAAATAGLHPAVSGPQAMRTAVLLGCAAAFPWHAAQARRAAALSADQLAAARQEGYQMCLTHVSAGLLAPPPATGGPGTGEPTPINRYTRGHIHITSDNPQERKAQ